ncbi:MAG: translation initiation factor IF-3 [Deltaproteobacteria bacterium CG_4_8_14_3_um_filter_51_11]|nr:translation initiation factor IF-3 [bacterium]OIP41632.1 MAG: translation initiation factor IF-3 [Desulfobacteraceae bacterium CG2_30_51_40]PIP45923.1 MAG: translation initiation factor IF-3 [Deltaproteobacteria bacterium CG23_combo_of_CG06-09_8_20_14_all_51_20]PIV99403.1 MAG: translation initiation factor IF-3 [Deltaproteobacteria bacterium CG17_big_fil_post_rev_8_21_14_2_50_51_6]PIX19192.1 MAG: translation initiation factor IF-3 [Deltaproteobacteria bacterium CG_4_8_14_3_um_filter_51_11]P
MAKKPDEVRVNERIVSRTVRVISSEGNQLGIIPILEALRIAREEGLDLVEVAPNADPPVCRVMDYGKFKYQTSKKSQEARKKTKAFQLKEIKVRPHTEEHDLGFKVKALRKFLENKNRVKVTVTFRGREMAYLNVGRELLKSIAEEVSDQGGVEQEPLQEARNRMSMVIVPK